MSIRKPIPIACLIAAAWALPLGLASAGPAAAATLPQQPTPAPAASTEGTTNLGSMVVSPQSQTNESAPAPSKIQIRRPSLHFNLNPGSGSQQPPNTGTPKPREPQTSRPPTPLHIVQPRYPRTALIQDEKGHVTVAFVINADGSTSQVHVLQSEPPRIFDSAAVAAVRRWRFHPATRDGNPVAVKVDQTLIFTPPGGKSAQHRRQGASSRIPAAAARSNKLVPLHLVPPRYPRGAYDTGTSGSVTVGFTVDKNGHTSGIHVIRANPPRRFNDAAISAVRKWRFKPLAESKRVVETIRFSPPR